MKVAEWHRQTVEALGFGLVDDIKVPVKGYRMGENNELRVGYEHVYVFEKVAG